MAILVPYYMRSTIDKTVRVSLQLNKRQNVTAIRRTVPRTTFSFHTTIRDIVRSIDPSPLLLTHHQILQVNHSTKQGSTEVPSRTQYSVQQSPPVFHVADGALSLGETGQLTSNSRQSAFDVVAVPVDYADVVQQCAKVREVMDRGLVVVSSEHSAVGPSVRIRAPVRLTERMEQRMKALKTPRERMQDLLASISSSGDSTSASPSRTITWDGVCVTDAESAKTPNGIGEVSARSEETVASLKAKHIASPIGSPATSLVDKSTTSPTGSPATKDAFSAAVKSVLRPLAKRPFTRRVAACDQEDSSRVTFQAPSRPSIVDSPNVCMPPDTPNVLSRSEAPSVYAATPKLDRFVSSTTPGPEQECPDTLSQMRTLAAYKRTKWAKTLEVKDTSPVALPLVQDSAFRERTQASTSSLESTGSPRVENSGELVNRRPFGGKSLPQVSPFTHGNEVYLGEPRDRVFVPNPIATPYWYHNPYASESPTKLTSAHSAQSLVYAPSLEVVHEGLITDVSMKSLPSDSSANWHHDDLGFTDSELRDLGWKLAGDSPVKPTNPRAKSPVVSPSLEQSALPATCAPSWRSDDMGCSESELERLGWRFGNPVSGARVTLGSSPVTRIEQQIVIPEPTLKAAFNPPPIQTPHWYRNHYPQGTPTPLTALESAESLVYIPWKKVVLEAPPSNASPAAPTELACIPGSPFLVKCLSPRVPTKVDTPVPSVFSIRYDLDGSRRILPRSPTKSARQRTRFGSIVNKVLPKKAAPGDQQTASRKTPLRLQDLNKLFNIEEVPTETLPTWKVSTVPGKQAGATAKTSPLVHLPKSQSGTLSVPAKVKSAGRSVPALERCKQEARQTPLVLRRLGTPASANVSPSPNPLPPVRIADKRKQDSRQTPLEEKLAKKQREHSPLAGYGKVVPVDKSLVDTPQTRKVTSSLFRPTKSSLLKAVQSYGQDKRKQDERQTPLEQKPAKKARDNSPSPRTVPTVKSVAMPSKGTSRSPWQTLSTGKARLLKTSIHNPESQAEKSPASVLSIGKQSPLGNVQDVQARSKA